MKRSLLLGCLLLLFISSCTLGASDNAVQTAIAETEAAAPTETVEPTITQTRTATAKPKATETRTPTPSDTDWVNENVQVKELMFFESGDTIPQPDQRDYRDQFSVIKARYINWEAALVHPSPPEQKNFTIRAVYYRSNGDWFGEVELNTYIKSDWSRSNHYYGLGWSEPGEWPVDEFRVDLYVDGHRIASDTFEMVLSTAEPSATPTPESTPTTTPRPGAIVDTDSLNVREGPDTVYGILTGVSEGDHLEILGKAYDCAWLKIETEDGIVGWVSADLVDYDLACSDIPTASIPPTPIPPPPTNTPKPEQPTAKPEESDAPSGKTIKVKIINNTGGGLTLHLQGPASYQFNFGTGTHNISVVPGNYTYTAWGCGTSASGSKKLKAGSEWEWFCK